MVIYHCIVIEGDSQDQCEDLVRKTWKLPSLKVLNGCLHIVLDDHQHLSLSECTIIIRKKETKTNHFSKLIISNLELPVRCCET